MVRGEIDKQKSDCDTKIDAVENKVHVNKQIADRKSGDLITRVDQLGS